MTNALSLIGAKSEAAVAYMSSHIPASAEALETVVGILMIAGFALLGASLPTML
ncbi:MAG TPA: hypothetical protein VFG44_02465 [Burkholderiales bacterium]|jgi:hypothetical protein|nr:hypothetical protein [Burkholderiales bacterium]